MGTKTVVMSDHHISDCAAPYSWCSEEELSHLSGLLTRIATEPDVDELVLLGDLLDFWLYPVDVVPLTAAEIIANNPSLTEALQRCVEKLPNVYYLSGNHDMGITENDLKPFSSGTSDVKLITPEQYHTLHPDRHLEHGNVPDMFNAPDNADDTIGQLPLGFFITRLVATSKEPEKSKATLHDALIKHAAEHAVQLVKPDDDESRHLLGKMLVALIVDTLRIDAKVSDDTLIRFSDPELDGRNITIGDVKKHYGSLLDTWLKKCDYNLDKLIESMLVGLRSDGLDWYAKEIEKSVNPSPLIVLGHTHHAEMKTPYCNDGCWCRTHGQTYAVIEDNIAKVIELS